MMTEERNDVEENCACDLRFGLLHISCLGQDLSKVSRAEDIGFSTERLVRITTFFQSDVDNGAIPGAVLLVARDGKVGLSTNGGLCRIARSACHEAGCDLSDCFDDEADHECSCDDAGGEARST